MHSRHDRYVLVFLLLIGGCALGRPPAPTPEAAAPRPAAAVEERIAPPAVPTATPAPRAEARPLTLDDAIGLALANNPDLRAASEHIAIAEARVGEATAAFYPQVSSRLSFARTDNPAQAFGMILAQRGLTAQNFNLNSFNNPGPTQDVRPEVSAAIPLFRGGQDYQRRAAALSGADAAGREHAAVRNLLVDAVVSAYYALLAAPEQVEVTRLSIQAVDSAHAQAQARFDAGSALKSDVLSLEVRLAAAREAHLRAQNAVELARAGLRTLLGLAVDAPVEIALNPTAAEAAPAATFDEALAQAKANRPELVAATDMVAMREHEVRVERAAYWPRIDAVASYGQDATNLELSHRRDNWTVGATAELDLFSGFRTAERVRAAEHQLAEARAAQHKTTLEVERDVRTAFLTYQEARERLQVTTAAVTAADEALRLVEAQYSAGAVTITRYLEAEVARTEARSHAIAARYDTRRAAAELRKAMGLWAKEYAR